MNTLYKLIVFTCVLSSVAAAQVTGLSDWNIYLDPGHGGTDNQGAYGYSEAHKNLRVGLNLRDILNNQSDIDTVFMSRTTDSADPFLSQRTTHANETGAAFFQSIHSNAGGSSANNVLMLWPQYPNGNEAVPHGGKYMSEIMVVVHSASMRIPQYGAVGECDFYGYSSCRSANLSTGKGGSRNYVQSYTDMASLISEAGFHTNPTQNQRNMNAEWKRLEAYSFFMSMLDYHDIPRPEFSLVTGFITNQENGEYINDATITIGDQSYTTDTFESLFYQYSNDPNQLHNGFYFLEDVGQGTHEMIVEAEGYYPDTVEVTVVDDFFTFTDVSLLSSLPPTIVDTSPAEGETGVPAWDPIQLKFSRSMNQASAEAAFSISPAANGSFGWAQNGRQLFFWPDEDLQYESEYTVTFAGTAEDVYGHPFDGNADSTGGDSYEFHFTTGPEDMQGPSVISAYPGGLSEGVELQPIITLTFNERIDPVSVDSATIQLMSMTNGEFVPGTVQQYDFPNRSVLSFFPGEQLIPDNPYMLILNPGYRDLLGNETEDQLSSRFETGATDFQVTNIDNFDAGVSNWWDPTTSGSTTGIVSDSTSRGGNTEYVNLITNSSRSMAVHFGWDTTNTSTWLLREYLSGGAPRNVTFDNSYKLQMYVFGDGSGNQVRFALDDNYPTSAAENHEVSPWYTIDWYGWKLISWDMSADGTGTWLGDGNLDGTLRFDSIQLTHVPGAAQFGAVYFDDLRLATDVETSLDDPGLADVPTEYQLQQNYPNPFNPTTRIAYTLPKTTRVQLTVYNLRGEIVERLVSGTRNAGNHIVEFDASNISSGIYLYRLETPDFTATEKMSVVK